MHSYLPHYCPSHSWKATYNGTPSTVQTGFHLWGYHFGCSAGKFRVFAGGTGSKGELDVTTQVSEYYETSAEYSHVPESVSESVSFDALCT
jgi:hypothetical protein